jgi:hypothetical protein
MLELQDGTLFDGKIRWQNSASLMKPFMIEIGEF